VIRGRILAEEELEQEQEQKDMITMRRKRRIKG